MNSPAMFMLPSPAQQASDLGGCDFFCRIFHWKGIKRKIPRIAVGAATGYLMGGGWQGAAAGGATAAAFKRKANASLVKDIWKGGLYGMVGGSVVGVGKELLGYKNSGYAGQATRYIRRKINPAPAPTPTAPTQTTGTVLRQTKTTQMNPSPAQPTWTIQAGIQKEAAAALKAQTDPGVFGWLGTAASNVYDMGAKAFDVVTDIGKKLPWDTIGRFMAPVIASQMIQPPSMDPALDFGGMGAGVMDPGMFDFGFPTGPAQGMPGMEEWGAPGGVVTDTGQPGYGGGGYPGTVLTEGEEAMQAGMGPLAMLTNPWVIAGGVALLAVSAISGGVPTAPSKLGRRSKRTVSRRRRK